MRRSSKHADTCEVDQSGPVFYSCSVFVPFWSSLLFVSVKEWRGKFGVALNLSNSLNDKNNKKIILPYVLPEIYSKINHDFYEVTSIALCTDMSFVIWCWL